MLTKQATEQAALAPVDGRLKVVEGDVNIGVRGRDFLVLFSKQVGSLVSLSYAGREFIAVPPAPQFWRATTDNDKGTSMGYHAGLWYAASLARACVAVELTEETTFVAVTFRYEFSIHSELAVSTTYRVMADGTVHVENRYKGAAGLPDLPQFALAFRVPADYRSWNGTRWDRKKTISIAPKAPVWASSATTLGATCPATSFRRRAVIVRVCVM